MLGPRFKKKSERLVTKYTISKDNATLEETVKASELFQKQIVTRYSGQ
jgi:hypothetical protein